MRMTPALHTGWLAQFALLNLSRHVRRTAVGLADHRHGLRHPVDLRGLHGRRLPWHAGPGHLRRNAGPHDPVQDWSARTGAPAAREMDPDHVRHRTRDCRRAARAPRGARLRAAQHEGAGFQRPSEHHLHRGRYRSAGHADLAPPPRPSLPPPPKPQTPPARPDRPGPGGVSLPGGLSSLLSLKEGPALSLLGSTIHGQANALDATVIDTYDTGTLATNDMSIYVPLELGRSLLDAPGQADRLTVVLPDLDQLDEVRARIQEELGKEEFVLTVQPWGDAAVTYRQVKAMFDPMFAFMFAILLALWMRALVKVVGMNVVGRSREIGGVRGVGRRQATTRHLFTGEAMWMGVLGCTVGLALTLLLRAGINSAHLGFTPPNFTDRVPLPVGIDPLRMALIAAAFAVGGTISAWFTARGAARRPIIDTPGPAWFSKNERK